MGLAIEKRREDLAHTARELHAIGPAQVLARGYSLTLDDRGMAISSAADATPGSVIETVLRDGRVRSTVDGGEDPGGAQADPRLSDSPPAPRRGRTPKASKDDAPGLFG